jgi:hypothetical protein
MLFYQWTVWVRVAPRKLRIYGSPDLGHFFEAAAPDRCCAPAFAIWVGSKIGVSCIPDPKICVEK